MDTTTFDTLARSVSTSLTRRSALRGLVAGMLLQSEDLSAKRRKRRKACQHDCQHNTLHENRHRDPVPG